MKKETHFKSAEKETNREEKIDAVRRYVAAIREKTHVKPGRSFLPELSCEALGEFYNLVERQLVGTEEGYGAWRELETPEILEGVYRYVTEGKKS